MKEKLIVKVMNFHSLIRVDSAKRQATKYMQMEKEVSEIIDMIVNNRNFILDKTMFQVDETKPPLNIYFGSDFGFCGSINFAVNKKIAEDTDGVQVLVGRKLRSGRTGDVIKINREDFMSRYQEVETLLYEGIRNNSFSEINVIYYQYNNISSIELTEKKVFPYDIKKHGNESYKEDYYVEGDMNSILINLITSFLNYEIKIAAVSSFASENIFRQNSTSESLKKIEEIEAEELAEVRKEKTQKEFKKVIDSYMKKSTKGARK
ncbi:MAG: F0F1 ATP synthase subunit gamma [Lachnospiraceae bacterium]|nr:F0F1 ATP synthase subunit gamma [Lachnospiraceae bacterium]